MKFTAKTGNSQDCAEVDGPSQSSGWGLTASHSAASLDHSALRCPLRVTSRASRSRPGGRIRANAGSDPPSPRAGRSCCCPGRPPQSSQRECNRECRRCAGTHSDGSAPETPQAPRAFRGQRLSGVREKKTTKRTEFAGFWSATKNPGRVSQCLSPRDGQGPPAGAFRTGTDSRKLVLAELRWKRTTVSQKWIV